MFCTNCGRQLPKDGTPCVCGSGQCEPAAVQQPAEPIATEPVAVENEWAGENPAVNWADAEPVQPTEPEPAPQVIEETPAEEIAAPVFEEAQPAAEQPAEVWNSDAAVPAPETTQPVYTEPQQPVMPQQPETTYAPQQPVYQPYVQPAPVYAPPAYTPPSYAVQPTNPVLDVIRGAASSPIFMIAAIVMSVHLLLSIIKAFVPFDFYGILYSFVPLLESIAPGMGYEMIEEASYVMSDLYAAQAMLGFLSLPSMIMPALTVAALWMIFVSAKNPDGPKTGGLTILQVLQILSLVGIGLSVLLAIFVIIFVCMLVTMLIEEMSYYGMYGGEDMTGVIVLVAIVLIIAVLAGVALSLVYAIKVLTSIINAKKAIKTGTVTKTASKFVVFYNFASAAFLLLDIFGTISLMGWVAGLVNLCAAGANVLFALVILQYNKAVKPLVVPKNAVGYIPQQPTPPTYPQY